MPEETLPVEALKANFAEKGFSVAEFVALCGSHAVRRPLCALVQTLQPRLPRTLAS
jgi:hypothetical protein